MDIKSFLIALKDKPLFYVMFCSDAELRPIYVRKFIEAHDGKAIYKEEDNKKVQEKVTYRFFSFNQAGRERHTPRSPFVTYTKLTRLSTSNKLPSYNSYH